MSNHKTTIGTKQLWGTSHTIDFHSIFFFSLMEVNGAKQLFGSNCSSKNIFLCVQQKKETHTTT